MIDHLDCFYYRGLQERYEVYLILFLELEIDHKIQLHYILELLYNIHFLKNTNFYFSLKSHRYIRGGTVLISDDDESTVDALKQTDVKCNLLSKTYDVC